MGHIIEVALSVLVYSNVAPVLAHVLILDNFTYAAFYYVYIKGIDWYPVSKVSPTSRGIWIIPKTGLWVKWGTRPPISICGYAIGYYQLFKNTSDFHMAVDLM